MIKKQLSYYLLIFLILLTIASNNTLISSELYNNNNQNPHFYFIQITDTHFGQGNQLKWAKKVVKAINELPIEIEFVVHTGDITYDKIHDKKLWRKAESILKNIKAPLHYIPGNHDILESKLQNTISHYKKHVGDFRKNVVYEGIFFIFFYDDPLVNSFIVKGYDPLGWIKAKLKQANKKPIIIFHHLPPFPMLSMKGFQGGWPEDVLSEWEEILNSYNVKAIITGHYHRDCHYWIGDIPVYVSTSVAVFPGRPSTFRIYEYKNSKVRYWTQYIEPNKNIFQKIVNKLK